MKSIREYSEKDEVIIGRIITDNPKSRIVITAFSEGGHVCTKVDLIDVLKYTKKNMLELWDSIK